MRICRKINWKSWVKTMENEGVGLEDKKRDPLDEDRVFRKIALSLSGGGYRAAAFHLGALKTLNKLGLLDDVKFLSTVSGGSIVGAAYISSIIDGVLFNDFEEKFITFLNKTHVINEAFGRLKKSEMVNDVRTRPSLIRAAADVYDESNILKGKRFSDLKALDDRFDEIIINSTEFRSGGSFRFVSSIKNAIASGSKEYRVVQTVVDDVRIADAVAASSCFPAGFEPIRFPADFKWPTGTNLAKIRALLGPDFETEMPLMDGGIFDNQGIDSIENIFERKAPDIGLFIISDTSARKSEGMELPVAPYEWGIPIWIWRIVLVVLAGLSLVSAAAIQVELKPLYLGENIFRTFFVYVIPLIFCLAILGLLLYVIFRLRQLLKTAYTKTGVEPWNYLRRLGIPEIIELGSSRLNSVIEMTTDVFMKRVRLMGFRSVFANHKIRPILVPCIIYDLDNPSRWGKSITPTLAPKPNVQAAAKRAESYQTNLWSTGSSDIDNLVKCGEATMCFKILRYLLEHRSSLIVVQGTKEQLLFAEVSKEWTRRNI